MLTNTVLYVQLFDILTFIFLKHDHHLSQANKDKSSWFDESDEKSISNSPFSSKLLI